MYMRDFCLCVLYSGKDVPRFGASTGSLSMFNYIMLSIYRPPSRTIRRRDDLELPIGQATTIDD